MTTQYINITGIATWAKVYDPDNAFGATKWKINIFPENDAEWEKIKAAGVQKKIKENNNPENNVPVGKYLEFTRDAFKVIKGQMVNFTGPVVEQDDGQVIVDYVKGDERVYSFTNEEKAEIARRGQPVLIGNGSKVTVRVAVYDTQKGKGQRLESVKIHDLVEYEADRDRELPPVINDVRKPIQEIDRKEPETNTEQPW